MKSTQRDSGKLKFAAGLLLTMGLVYGCVEKHPPVSDSTGKKVDIADLKYKCRSAKYYKKAFLEECAVYQPIQSCSESAAVIYSGRPCDKLKELGR